MELWGKEGHRVWSLLHLLAQFPVNWASLQRSQPGGFTCTQQASLLGRSIDLLWWFCYAVTHQQGWWFSCFLAINYVYFITLSFHPSLLLMTWRSFTNTWSVLPPLSRSSLLIALNSCRLVSSQSYTQMARLSLSLHCCPPVPTEFIKWALSTSLRCPGLHHIEIL